MHTSLMNFKSFSLVIIASYCFSTISAQSKEKINFSLGLSATYAPNLTWDHRQTQGAFLSVFGDLQISETWIGRLQFSQLVPSTLASEEADQVINGYSTNGSIGYNLIIDNSKLEVPIMATLGLAHINWEEGGFDWSDYGMQMGLTISPQYYIRDQFAITAAIRYLKGLAANQGAVFNQLDFSLGARFTII